MTTETEALVIVQITAAWSHRRLTRRSRWRASVPAAGRLRSSAPGNAGGVTRRPPMRREDWLVQVISEWALLGQGRRSHLDEACYVP